MKIGIVGCGAIGSYYGGRLHQRGHSIHALLRSDRDHVQRHGIHVTSPEGDFYFRPKVARTPSSIGPCELVLVCFKTTSNDQYRTLIEPLVDSSTMILTLQNGLGNVESLSTLFPLEQILGGLCFICVNRSAPGTIHHIDHGRIVLGEAQGWPEPRTHDLATQFKNAGIPCQVTDDLKRSQWEKLVWNVPFNGLGVASCIGHEIFADAQAPIPASLGRCLPTDQLLSDDRWRSTVKALMLEVIHVANELGLPLGEKLADTMIEKTKSMGAYRPSTLIDFEERRPLELDSVFKLPLQQAQQTAVETPILERLNAVLAHLQDAKGVESPSE